MHTRILGNSGFQVSEVGLGCWQFGGDFGPMTKEEAFDIMEASVQGGVNFFDTADVYGAGISESYIGEFTKTRKDIIVATKYGRDGIVYPNKYSFDNMRDSILKAGERLQMDSLDLLQLHCVPHDILKEGHIFEWLRRCQADGIIKAWGASVESIDEGLTCLSEEGLTSLQVIFNIFRQKLASQLLPQAQTAGVGIIVRLPLASGLLAGKYSSSTKFASSDHRNYNADGQFFNVGETFAGLPFQKGVEFADHVKGLLPSDTPMAQYALRWILDHEAVTTIIPGASSASQARENAKVSHLPHLDLQINEELQELYHSQIESHIRGPY